MIIRGKEYKFLYTVRASIDIAKNLDGHNIQSIVKVFNLQDQVKSMDLIIDMAIACNKAYLKAEAFENGTKFEENQVITRDLIESLTMIEESELENELFSAISAGTKTEVETTPAKAPKGTKKKQGAK